MAYSKLPRGMQDYAVGFQAVNQARDNLEAARAELTPEHGTIELSAGRIFTTHPTPTRRFGRHNTPVVPRASVLVTGAGISGGAGYVTMDGDGSAGIVTGCSRWASGLYFLSIDGLATYWAECQPRQTGATAMRMVRSTSYFAAGRGQNNGIFLEALQLNTGSDAFERIDFAFSATVYGTL